MSWISGCVVIDDKSQNSLNEAYSKIASSVRHSADLEEFPNMGEHISSIKEVCSGKIFESYEDAQDYFDETRDAWSRKYSPLVAFKDIDSAKETSKIISLKKRIETEREKLYFYDKNHNISDFKAAFIGCPHCKSKINKEFTRSGNRCPVCFTDMRSNTILNTIQRYKDNIEKLQNAILVEKQKQIDKLPIKYIVCYTEYVG